MPREGNQTQLGIQLQIRHRIINVPLDSSIGATVESFCAMEPAFADAIDARGHLR
jgi:hypothetical protein